MGKTKGSAQNKTMQLGAVSMCEEWGRFFAEPQQIA